MVTELEIKALQRLKRCKRLLTPQQFRTLRGQILAGDPEAAMAGLVKILGHRGVVNGIKK